MQQHHLLLLHIPDCCINAQQQLSSQQSKTNVRSNTRITEAAPDSLDLHSSWQPSSDLLL
jgi:hypothetical protein